MRKKGDRYAKGVGERNGRHGSQGEWKTKSAQHDTSHGALVLSNWLVHVMCLLHYKHKNTLINSYEILLVIIMI